MSNKFGYSSADSSKEVLADLKNQLINIEPKMVIFFASTKFDPVEISKGVKALFPSSEVFGCTTSGEVISGKMLKNSVVAMAFDSDTISDLKVEVVQNLKEGVNVSDAFTSFEKYFNTPASELDYTKYVGVVLTDGLSGAEEKVMDKIGDLTNVAFVGGSIGDDLKFSKTYAFANGEVYENATILALLKPAVEFSIIKTQSFNVLDKKFVATTVNEAEREILEFDNIPATKAYADAVGLPVDKISEAFMHSPVGFIVNNEIFVRSPQRTKGESIVFYCNIMKGMEVSLLESTDIIKDTEDAIKEAQNTLGSISALINFHCILRTLDLEKRNLTVEYGKVFSDIPTIGFSTYGESYIGHINQTSTMIAFK